MPTTNHDATDLAPEDINNSTILPSDGGALVAATGALFSLSEATTANAQLLVDSREWHQLSLQHCLLLGVESNRMRPAPS